VNSDEIREIINSFVEGEYRSSDPAAKAVVMIPLWEIAYQLARQNERPLTSLARLRRIYDIATRLLAEPPNSTDTADLMEICDQVEEILGSANVKPTAEPSSPEAIKE
jgi:hypothetical protein